ncbi:hypothetical protein [Pleurocapsa sp. PCC 7327]|nr:hypothetical protein [Pleurocapsa sp. PCC 7327]
MSTQIDRFADRPVESFGHLDVPFSWRSRLRSWVLLSLNTNLR